MKRIHWAAVAYVCLAVVLAAFSYTQVDLNLTLSQSNIIHTVETAFQHVGYYQRPLSTFLYVVILSLLFVSYAGALRAVRMGMMKRMDVWKTILTVTVILVFSYPAAFSYDFFNYLFTAKTVLVYRQNPYIVTPLAFAGVDPWTNFMRWTHLTTAYAPLWIGMTLVPYIAGFGYFVTTLFAMKAMIAGFYLLAVWALERAISSVRKHDAVYALAVVALNPLMLMESLVSAHNDIVLIAFAMLAVGAYLKRDRWMAVFYTALSVGAKFVTVALFPVFALGKGRKWLLAAMLCVLAAVLSRREFLPWYWVWIVPFVGLLPEYPKLIRGATIVSFGLLLSYAPFLYFGEYSLVEQGWKTWSIWTGVMLGAISLLIPVSEQAAGRRSVPVRK